jgi:hypothetical protein
MPIHGVKNAGGIENKNNTTWKYNGDFTMEIRFESAKLTTH